MNSQGTSFIPQRPTEGKIKSRGVRKIYILATVSYIFFFATALAAAGIFFYKVTVDKQLHLQQQTLATEKSKFSQSDIASVTEMDKRLSMAKERMNKHISVLSILEALEHSAVQTVQYSSFEYKRPTDDAPSVTFMGNADTFDSVLFQREVLQSNPILASAVFTDVSQKTDTQKDNSGKSIAGTSQNIVSFSLQADVPVSLVGYTPRTAATSSNDAQNILSQAPSATTSSTTNTNE